MSKQTLSYALSSAEWLRGIDAHIKYGSRCWVVGRAKLAASEIDNCLAEIADLEARLEKANEELAKLQNPSAVRTNVLMGKIAVPDDLVWLHDTEGPVADLRARLEKAEAERGELAKELEKAIPFVRRALKSPS